MFGKAEAEVSKSERAGAKMINFGIADEMIVECSRELTEDVRALTVEKMQTAPFGAKKMGQAEWVCAPSPFCACPTQLAVSPFCLRAMQSAITAPNEGIECREFRRFGRWAMSRNSP